MSHRLETASAKTQRNRQCGAQDWGKLGEAGELAVVESGGQIVTTEQQKTRKRELRAPPGSCLEPGTGGFWML